MVERKLVRPTPHLGPESPDSADALRTLSVADLSSVGGDADEVINTTRVVDEESPFGPIRRLSL